MTIQDQDPFSKLGRRKVGQQNMFRIRICNKIPLPDTEFFVALGIMIRSDCVTDP